MSFLVRHTLIRRNLFLLVSAILAAFMLSACGAHGSSGAHLVTARPIAAPHGIVGFCDTRPDICNTEANTLQASETEDQTQGASDTTAGSARVKRLITTDPAPFMGDSELLELARQVNADVNNALTYRTDIDNWGRDEAWLLPLTDNLSVFGDCEDFALEKRQRLIALGVPTDRLALATGSSRATGYHAVLILRTDHGDYVLDNASRHIHLVNNTPYIWDRLQTGPNLLAWAEIEGYGAARVADVSTAG